MKPAFRSFTGPQCYERIGEILAASETSYPEVNSIPDEGSLTYSNGYYVNCTALFVDIRGSSQLPQAHKRPTLAKLYRVYISEMVAAMSANDKCAHVRIVGDCVSGIFNTPYQDDINSVFSTGAILASTVDIINYRLAKASISEIRVGIGMAYGRALMIKAGFKGSGINDVVWMGDVVNEASNLCGFGNATYSDRSFMVSPVVYNNLNARNQSLLVFSPWRNCYHGNIISRDLDQWLTTQRSAQQR